MDIGIIGSGVSGIAAAKEFIKSNYNVKIFEKNSDIGGIWLTKSYPTCRVQTTKKSYSFSDIPFSDDADEYPYREEVLEYLNKVCETYNIKEYINFNCNVTDCSFDSLTEKWKITYNENYSYICDYLIVSSGFYTDNRKYEAISSKELVGKKIFYPKDFSFRGNIKPSHFRNKDVVVIGNGPSGCDLSVLAKSNGAKSVTVIYRRGKWICKRYFWDILSTEFIINRTNLYISEKLSKKYRVIIATVMYYLLFILAHGIVMRIDTPNEPYNRSNIVLNENFLKMVYKSDIKYIKSKETYISDNKIKTDKEEISYDICVLSIGYENTINFMNLDSIPKMHKHIINPDHPNCAFIGFAASFNWPLVSETQSKWYIDYIENKSTSKEDIISELEIEKEDRYHDYHDLGLGVFRYLDQIEISK